MACGHRAGRPIKLLKVCLFFCETGRGDPRTQAQPKNRNRRNGRGRERNGGVAERGAGAGSGVSDVSGVHVGCREAGRLVGRRRRLRPPVRAWRFRGLFVRAPKPAEKETGFWGGWSRASVYHVRYDAIAFDGATIAIPDQGEPGVIVARGVAAHFAAATHHRGGFGRCGYARGGAKICFRWASRGFSVR